MDDIASILLSLGIGKRYKGHAFLCYGLRLALEDETRLYNVRRELFAPIAEAFNTNDQAIERNVRTVIAHGWLTNRAGMEALAGYPMAQPPSAKEFMDILVAHLQRQSSRAASPDAEARACLGCGNMAEQNSRACSDENLLIRYC